MLLWVGLTLVLLSAALLVASVFGSMGDTRGGYFYPPKTVFVLLLLGVALVIASLH